MTGDGEFAAIAARRSAEQPDIAAPRDIPFPATLSLHVDATDVDRGILQGRLRLPLHRPGHLTLLYPKWMPGYHSPQNPIELFAGLKIVAGDLALDWRRDAIEVYAFHIDVPEGVDVLDITFQFLSPTTSSQGDVVVTHDMLNLQWGRLLVYPAGYYARRIEIRPSLTLPTDWPFASVLDVEAIEGDTIQFADVSLDVLIDSPVMAARASRELVLDDANDVRMVLFARDEEPFDVGDAQLKAHQAVVQEAVMLFGSTHFDRYCFLTAMSDEMGGGGIEHHQSAELVLKPDHFTNWDRNLPSRDVVAHEFVHAWNGKFRRGADSWTPSFELPIRNSLMWVYEGQTQYWGHVLAARSGLWTKAHALQALAKVAATYDIRPGGLWRTMADTTRDPIIASRAPLPWPSWQRSEDYYSQGQLLWLSVDTLIRELSGDARSLDDFARTFFGIEDGETDTRTYTFEDVVQTLDDIAEYDWAGFLNEELQHRHEGAPLEGLERGGYRLVYRDHRTDFCRRFDALYDQLDVRFSIGLVVTSGGLLQEVMWGSAAFEAKLTAGSQLHQVNGQPFSLDALKSAIAGTADGAALTLRAATRSFQREVTVDYRNGLRFPHLERLPDRPDRLDQLLTARSGRLPEAAQC